MNDAAENVEHITIKNGDRNWLENGIASFLSLYDLEEQIYRIASVVLTKEMLEDILAEGQAAGSKVDTQAWLEGFRLRRHVGCTYLFDEGEYVFQRGADFTARE